MKQITDPSEFSQYYKSKRTVESYDEVRTQTLKKRLVRMIEKEFFQSRAQSASSILELGPGTCEITAVLAQSARVLGIEASQEMIAFGAPKIVDLDVELKLMSMFDIDELDETFDAVVASRVFLHLDGPDLERMLRLCRDRLKPNGLVIFDLQHPNLVKKLMDRFDSSSVYNFPYSKRKISTTVDAVDGLQLDHVVLFDHFLPLAMGVLSKGLVVNSRVGRALKAVDNAMSGVELTANRWGVVCRRV